MKYKDYTGTVEVDEESKVLFGRVIGLRDMITFEGESFSELEQAFHDSVDVYLDLCAERGESPEKPFSGRILLRIEPSLHRQLSDTAEAAKQSLNSLVQSALEAKLNESARASVGRIAAQVKPTKPKTAAGAASSAGQSGHYMGPKHGKDKETGRRNEPGKETGPGKESGDVRSLGPKGKEHAKKR